MARPKARRKSKASSTESLREKDQAVSGDSTPGESLKVGGNGGEAEPTPDQEATMTAEENGTPRLYKGNGVWHGQYETVAGLNHRDARVPMPCQDAALATTQPRPVLLVADGAGSAAVSEMGSQNVVTGLARLLYTLEQQLVAMLDHPTAPEEEATRAFGLVLVKHAKGLLEDLAQAHRRPQKDFRCTLLAAVAGKYHLLWLKIGDGALVVEQIEAACKKDEEGKPILQPSLRTLGKDGKGEFANQTTFIDEKLAPDDVQTGCLPVRNITGMALMSDGAAERLVSNDGSRVSAQISSWLESLRRGELKRRVLTQRFYSGEFTQGTHGDDCGIALNSVELEASLFPITDKPS